MFIRWVKKRLINQILKEVDQAACKLMMSTSGLPCPDLFSIFTKALAGGIKCMVTEFAKDTRLSGPVNET